MNLFAKFVAFDLETTGLSVDQHEIIEIGAVKFTVEERSGVIFPRILSTFQTFVRPTMLIPKEATNVNHITDAMVENAPLIAESLSNFTRFCGQDTILVAHNADFDASFLRKAYAKSDQITLGNPIIDSLRIARKLYPEFPNHRLGTIANIFKKRNIISMSIEQNKMHRAVYDCEMLMEVLVAMLKGRMKNEEWDMSKVLPSLLKHGGTTQTLRKTK